MTIIIVKFTKTRQYFYLVFYEGFTLFKLLHNDSLNTSMTTNK